MIYGADSPEVALLKRFRDRVLIQLPNGRDLIRLYYRLSPDLAQAVENSPVVTDSLKAFLDQLMPLVALTTD
jgi:hypothetical protein